MGQLRHSSPTWILDRPTAQHAPAPARASLAPPAAPTTSSLPWRPSSTPGSLEWIPSALLPRRPTLTPRSPTTPTRTLSPAQPPPTLRPSTPTLELGRDVSTLQASSSETNFSTEEQSLLTNECLVC